MSLLRFLFPFLCRQPQPGDRYVWDEDANNPFNSYFFQVVNVNDGWVEYATSDGINRRSPVRHFLAFFPLRRLDDADSPCINKAI